MDVVQIVDKLGITVAAAIMLLWTHMQLVQRITSKIDKLDEAIQKLTEAVNTLTRQERRKE